MPPGEDFIEVNYELTWGDFLAAIKLTRPRFAKAVTWFLAAFALVAVIGEAVLFLASSAENPQRQRVAMNLLPMAALAVVWWMLAYFGIYLSAKKQFRGSPSSQVPIHLMISEEGLRFETSLGESRTSWRSFIKYSENPQVFVIRPSPVIFNVIPKRAFTEDQVKAFQAILHRNVHQTR